jgi:hypothetical protein
MAIPSVCPSCGATLNVPDTLRGKRIRCKKCEQVFLVGEVPAKKSSAKPAGANEGIQPEPLPIPPDDRDVRRRPGRVAAKAPVKEGSSTLKVLAIVGGIAGFLLLVCCGGVSFVVYRLTYAVKDINDQVAEELEKSGVFIKEPADVSEALAYLKSDAAGKRQVGANWLAKAPLDPGRQAEVAAALEALLGEKEVGLQAAGARGLATWGTRDNVPALLRLLDANPTNVTDLQRQAMATLGKLQDPRAAEPVARYLGVAVGDDHARKALEAQGPTAE